MGLKKQGGGLFLVSFFGVGGLNWDTKKRGVYPLFLTSYLLLLLRIFPRSLFLQKGPVNDPYHLRKTCRENVDSLFATASVRKIQVLPMEITLSTE